MQFYKPLSYYLFFTLVCTNVLFGAKNDIVILKNGDKVTCELKELQAGKLRVSTDDMGTVYIEWDKIATITATARYEVELQFGSIYFGSLGPAADSRKINVYGDSLTYDLFKAFVVRITPIEDTFIDRLDGSASLGLNYTKANDLAQLILNGDSRYRSRENLFSVSLSSTITEQKDKKTTQYHNLDFKFTRFLDRRWFWGIISRAQQNTEQGIDLRLSLGAGGGRTILQSNNMLWKWTGGLQVTREWVSGAAANTANIELPLGTDFHMFIYDDPETDITSSLIIFPNLTNIKRVRTEFDIKGKRELINDFILSIDFDISYDNKPPNTEAAKDDYRLVFSFGYKW